ncbi:MAG: MotA/TolQ/ExbB proton channel family protein [Proteobacteria bacterium]|jgi:chemotaxis protein MotA|nr:MotA/TolQ/ExbB proton channel family protein [Pseudomonadota bacterium]
MRIAFSSILGLILGLGLLGYAVFGGEPAVYWGFVQPAGLAIVLGGTLAATMVSYEGRYVWKAFGTLLQVVIPTSVSQKSLFGTVETVIGWGRVGAKDGIAALESEFAKVDTEKDAFLHHCIQLFLAGYDKENLKGKLDTFINSSYQRNMVRASILNTMANVAPAFGMLGTLIGLVLMLASLDGGDSSSLGSALSVALLTTLYGTLFAQLIFKPASRRAEQKEQIMRFKNQLTAEGFLLLISQANSVEIQDHLNSFLDPAIHFDSAKQ